MRRSVEAELPSNILVSFRVIASSLVASMSKFVMSFRIIASSLLLPFVLEVLYFALVLYGLFAGLKRTKVAALSGLRVWLARVEPVLARSELSDHFISPFDLLSLPDGSDHAMKRGNGTTR